MDKEKFYLKWKKICEIRGVKIEFNKEKDSVLVDGVRMETVQKISDYLNPKPILPQFRR